MRPPESVTQQSVQSVSSGFENLSEEKQKEMLDIIAEVNSVETPPVKDDMPKQVNDSTVEQAEKSYQIIATAGHPAEGSVRVIETPEGSVIRYENFSTINGPRLHLYLAKSLEVDDFIDLGPIRGAHAEI